MDSPFERNYLAKQIRNIRKIVRDGKQTCDCQACEVQLIHNKEQFHSAVSMCACIALATLLLLFASCEQPAHAETIVAGYPDAVWVNAIYKSEGGPNATYLYGIRSLHYRTPAEAQNICRNTVRNNWRRYK